MYMMSEITAFLYLGGPVFFVFALLEYGMCQLRGILWRFLPAALGVCLLCIIFMHRNPNPGCGLGDAILSVWVWAAVLGMLAGWLIYAVLR